MANIQILLSTLLHYLHTGAVTLPAHITPSTALAALFPAGSEEDLIAAIITVYLFANTWGYAIMRLGMLDALATMLAKNSSTSVIDLVYNHLPYDLKVRQMLMEAVMARTGGGWFLDEEEIEEWEFVPEFTSSTHDICIFCASRLSGAPAAPPLAHRSVYVPRRHLNASRKASQSSAQAAAVSQDDPPAQAKWGSTFGSSEPTADEAPRPGKWGSTFAEAPPSDLTPEEQRLRDALRARARAAQQDERAERSRWGADRDAPDMRRFQFGQRPPRREQSERNPRHGSYRLNMNPSKPQVPQDPPFDPNLTANWKHLKRRTSDNGREAAAQTERSSPSSAPPLFRRVEMHRHAASAQQQPMPQGYVSLNGTPPPVRERPAAKAIPPRRVEEAPPRRVEEAPSQRAEEASTVQSEQASDARVEPPPPIEERPQPPREERRSIPRRFLDEGPRRRGRADREETARRNRVSYEQDLEEGPRERLSKAERKKQKKAEKRAAAEAEAAAPTPIYLPEFISVTNLASALRVRLEDFVAKMEELGFENVEGSHVLTAENAGLIAMEYNFEPIASPAEEDIDLRAAPELSAEERTTLPARPPVVTIMGHVDHGKTTILDYLRKSSIAASEHGGITQHIGAFSVPLASSNKTITFLDTPGHAAFLSMRQRGAHVTDIVILVVAADDSVKPQTVEAIRHAKAARVPVIVAINKCDKEEAKPDVVKADLARHGIEVEDFGGDVQCICVSGKTGLGMRELEEAAVTLSEILDHRADVDGPVEGWVLEATTKKSGRVATVLVRRGTLRPGDVLVAGTTWARVRSLRNEAGVLVKEVGPGMPVEVDGWKGQPVAGDEVLQAPDEGRATEVVRYREEKVERESMAKDMEAINEARRLEAEKREREEAAARAAENGEKVPDDAVAEAAQQEGGRQEIFFVLKADVSGSVEAVLNAVSALGNAEVAPHVLRSAVGPVTQFDIEHAAAAKGHIISFNTAVEPKMAQMAESQGVRILDQSIIYRLVDDVKAVLSERLPPVTVQRVTGEAEVAMEFEINVGGRKTMKIAGVKVRNGVVGRGNRARVIRGKETIYDGTVSSLKSSKKDVPEMRKGTECGMGFDNWEAFQVGDQIQCYEEKTEKRTL